MSGAFLQSTSSTADASVYTFSAQNLGTAAADRYIVVSVATRKAGSTTTVSSVSIGGVTATLYQRTNTVTNTNVGCLAIAAVPTGTTGDVVVTMGATMLRMRIGMWRLDDLASATPHDNDSSVATAPTVNLDVPDDSYAIGTACAGGATGTTWTELTEVYDADTEAVNFRSSGAAKAYVSATSAVTMTATFAGSPTESVGVFASWAFGAAGGLGIPIAAYHYNHHLKT